MSTAIWLFSSAIMLFGFARRGTLLTPNYQVLRPLSLVALYVLVRYRF